MYNRTEIFQRTPVGRGAQRINVNRS